MSVLWEEAVYDFFFIFCIRYLGDSYYIEEFSSRGGVGGRQGYWGFKINLYGGGRDLRNGVRNFQRLVVIGKI